MHRIIYASTAKSEVNHELVLNIVKKASEFNQSLGITGALLFNQNYFVQLLEGSEENINFLYHKIVKDQRHDKLRIIKYQPIEKRLFPKWGMRLLTGHSLAREIYYAYGEDYNLNPYKLAIGDIESLFLEIEKKHQELIDANKKTA